ncbi:putative type I restriction enzymeP M protein [Abditibacteriota bacterium]|nr:putative type I restriction enzymeP M protein [Abditibacteriota bacterium]
MEKLTVNQKKSLLTIIKRLDPDGDVVTLQPDTHFRLGTVEYNLYKGLVLHETITRLTDEEWVRAYLVVRLVKELRYPANSIELETTYSIGHDSVKKAQIDVKVTDKRDSGRPQTFMIIEAKRPDEWKTFSESLKGQVFDLGKQEHANGVRYGVWYSLDFVGDLPRDSCIVIDLQEHPEHNDWVDAGEPGHNLDLPIEYGLVRKQTYANISEETAKEDPDGPQPLREDVTRDELSRLQRDFHNVLWGGAKMGDTQVFDNLLKIFLAKIYDELTTNENKPYRFQVELHNGKPETPEQITTKINKLITEAVKNFFPDRNADAALLAIDSDVFKPNKVMLTVERLEGISIVRNTYQDDVLGAFFESIVRTGFKQDKGQFFTHSKIAHFILYALELDLWPIELINSGKPRLPYIIDPSCGSGTFLLEAMKLITESVLKINKDKLARSHFVVNFLSEMFQPFSPNKNSHNIWARQFIFGIEGSPNLAMATKVNMILHGDGNANILFGDGLAPFDTYPITHLKTQTHDENAPYKSFVNEQFDCVISNPPFSLKEDARTLSEYARRFDYAGEKNSEALFVERWFQLLKEKGRLGVVLPDSIFDTNENLPVRMMLYRLFHIRAVVSLPPVTFQPYTPTKTSLLFAVKKARDEVEAWDDTWRKATNEYGKLRRSKVIEFVLQNDRLRNRLIGKANRLGVEWYPADSILHAGSLPAQVRTALIATASGNTLRELNKDLVELDSFLAADALSKIDSDEARKTLSQFLRDRTPKDSADMTLRELVTEGYDDIVQAGTLDFAQTIKDIKYTNSWWCFAEVSSQAAFNSQIFFAEAKEVGYKRTTRHPDGIERPNQLFTEVNGQIMIDTEIPKSILDHLRGKKVFSI